MNYPTNEELLRRSTEEDNFIERKLEGVSSEDLRKTMVAFANSVPDGRYAVLYIGMDDQGNIAGVQNTDSLQKKISKYCIEDCYPAIAHRTEVLQRNGTSFIAVVIEPSRTKPHFSGAAYVRQGSQSVRATERLYDELILSRNDKARAILT